jgi:plasmid stabilization system protein ParE
VVWTRAAEADLQAAYEELEAFHDGAGDNLLLLIDAAVELLRQFPEMAPVFDGPFRRPHAVADLAQASG